MTLTDQNVQEVCELKPSLLRPKSIVFWNLQTMYECGKAKRTDNDTQKLC